MKLNPTTGIATVSQELNAVVNISAIRIEQIVDYDYVIANHETIVQQGNDNAIIIADSLNTYQQCGKLPSVLLSERNELIKALSDLYDSAQVIPESMLTESQKLAEDRAMNLLTKIKAE